LNSRKSPRCLDSQVSQSFRQPDVLESVWHGRDAVRVPVFRGSQCGVDEESPVALQRQHDGRAGREAAIRDRAYVEGYVDEVLAARALAYEGLHKLGIKTFPSEANFILFRAGERAIPIRDALRERGVLVRDRSYEIPGCVRVTIGTRQQIERFLEELGNFGFDNCL